MRERKKYKGALVLAIPISMISIGIGLVLGTISIIPSMIFLEEILRFFGAKETILPFAKAYMYIFILGLIFNIINIALNHLARAEGANKTSMNTLLIGFIFNIILALGKECLLLSLGRQGIFLIPVVLILPQMIDLNGVILSQPVADIMTVLLTMFFSIKLKKNMLVIQSIERVNNNIIV